ncbi:hypothetical protein RvY_06765 [Ramazzottius varieornatus]|uniref:CUB domain-containing protein n=1 Tax=Ramazzottius varieornatus TaxID=947166 RepID=A0A1D1V992_RAMVA|nr:hypothetical protein RvY_06765 [Ramazzottius varieornatus]
MFLTDRPGLLVLFLTALFRLASSQTIGSSNGAILCSGTRTIQSSPHSHWGYITSPNHSQSYPAENMQCTFKFQPKADEQIQLIFSYFNLRESGEVPATTNCDLSDSVKIFIGTSRTNFNPGNQLGEYCGKKHPEIVMAVGQPLTVIFTVRTKENPNIKALHMFKAKYAFTKDYGIRTQAEHNKTAGCHFIFDGRRVSNTGDFDSPNFGGLYPYAVNCLYTFRAYGNQSIRLNFNKFEVDGHHDCRRPDDDYVYFQEGELNWKNFASPADDDDLKRTKNATLYCGKRAPPQINFGNRVVNVLFKSGQQWTNHGFRGTYTFVGHPGVFLPRSSSTKGTISSTTPTSLTLLALILAQCFS